MPRFAVEYSTAHVSAAASANRRSTLEREQALDLAVVVERAFTVESRPTRALQPLKLQLLEIRPLRAVGGRIGEALEGVDVVGGDQLTPLALVGRVWREVSAGYRSSEKQGA